MSVGVGVGWVECFRGFEVEVGLGLFWSPEGKLEVRLCFDVEGYRQDEKYGEPVSSTTWTGKKAVRGR
jgi:hypothetical protein